MPYPWKQPLYTQPQTPSQLPLSNPQPPSRSRTRAYAHRVQESLTTRTAKVICSIFLSLLFTLGLIFFIVWLSLRPHRPRFHVVSFSYPGVADNSSDITFVVSDRNPNGDIGIYYDTTMEGSVYYEDKKIGMRQLHFPFYQPPKNTTMIRGVFVESKLAINDGLGNKLANDASNGRVMFRLELAVVIRFRVTTWDSHHHKLHVNCDVVTARDGNILPESMETRCPIYFS